MKTIFENLTFLKVRFQNIINRPFRRLNENLDGVSVGNEVLKQGILK